MSSDEEEEHAMGAASWGSLLIESSSSGSSEATRSSSAKKRQESISLAHEADLDEESCTQCVKPHPSNSSIGTLRLAQPSPHAMEEMTKCPLYQHLISLSDGDSTTKCTLYDDGE